MADPEELREAAYELQQYLSDRLAPLMVVDAITLLVGQPADIMAREINVWVAQQGAAAEGMSLGDLYYHAAQKVSMMGQLDLVPRPQIGKCLGEVSAALLPLCPEEDRDLLRQNIERLRTASLAGATPAPALLTRPPTEAPRDSQPTGVLTRAAQQGLRRLSLFLERLRPLGAGATGGGSPAPQAAPGTAAPMPSAFDPQSEATSQFISAAAAQAKSAQELEQHLAPLRNFGIDTGMNEVVRALANNLPGWGTLPVAPGSAPQMAGLQLNAMRQIVSLASTPEEAGGRFRELAQAAIEQFNLGSLGRSATMFELAEHLAAEDKVKTAFVEPVRKRGHEQLDAERLRRAAERPESRPDLRRILTFFESLRPDGLLKSLDGEPRRDRRQRLLALLETHGDPARSRAWEVLRASVEPGAKVDPYFQMNLVYLLRVIPRPAFASLEDELGVVIRTPGRDSPPPVVKQVIAYLGSVRHEKAERGLISYLHVFENMLLQPDTAVYGREDVETLIERTCAALARYATPRSWRALVDHALKSEPRLGLPMARIVEAGRQDLSTSPDVVERLLSALKAELPRNVFGLAVNVKRNDDRILWLIQALGGTPLPEVVSTLREVAEKHRGQKFAEAAEKVVTALTTVTVKTDSSLGLSGDLDLFGLPGLLQTLGQSQLTGVLSLMRVAGRVEASVLLEKGRFRGAQYGALGGAEAVYEVFERPFPGTFSFVSRADISGHNPTTEPMDLMGLLLEGVRRHDEFKRAAVLVPDRAKLKPSTTTKATGMPEETPDFMTRLWTAAARGATALECEAAMKVDGYRVRRMLAHWVEQGAFETIIPSA